MLNNADIYYILTPLVPVYEGNIEKPKRNDENS